MSSKKRILIAVDNSDNADNALRNYFENFHNPDNEVILIHIVDPMRVHAANALKAALIINEGDVKKREEERSAKVQQTTDKYMSLCKDVYHTEIRMLIRESRDVGQVIIQAAEAEKCSSIVVGCQGHGLRRAILGSISSYVLHHSSIPVAVCK